MDVRTALLALLAPVDIGDELEPGVRLVGASTELGLRLSFEVGGQPVHVEVSPVEEGRPFAARTDRLSFAYRSGGGTGSVDHEAARAVCAAVASAAARHEQAVLERMAEQARAFRERSEGATRVREVAVDRLLEPSGNKDKPYFTLSPYVGCLIGCRFCYAQSRVATVRRLEGLPEAPWGSFVDARVNAPDVLARELASLPRRPIKFCPIVSDPYHAIEARLRLTRRCLETLRDAAAPPPVMVLTRSGLVQRDADVLAELPEAFVGASVPTLDDDVRRHFERRAAPISERLAMLAALRERGLGTFAVVQPLLPGPVVALADALAAVVDSVSIDVLHGTAGAEREFSDPRFAHAREDAWQAERARELAAALGARGVRVWGGELPPELA